MATAAFFIILILPYPEKSSSVSQVCLVIVVVMITWQWKYIDYRLLPISITLSRLLSVFAFSACWSESQLRFYYTVFCFVFFRQEHFICLCNIDHIYIYDLCYINICNILWFLGNSYICTMLQQWSGLLCCTMQECWDFWNV